MNHVYVLQDKTGYVVGATYEEPKAMQKCNENQGWTYRVVPFYSCRGTKIEVTAGPIVMPPPMPIGHTLYGPINDK